MSNSTLSKIEIISFEMIIKNYFFILFEEHYMDFNFFLFILKTNITFRIKIYSYKRKTK